MKLRGPLHFRPVYQTLVWGGQRLRPWRREMPEGPIGESWDLADHARGMSVVSQGPLAGRTLHELVREAGAELVGPGFRGDTFPLMIKLIDAAHRLSVQVHPDETTSIKLGAGAQGKTECWVILSDGGCVFQGLHPGTTRQDFEHALAACRLEPILNRFEARDRDVFFIEARTVHAIGEDCLLYEVQQTCDTTYRVYDWDRMGLDGKPRPLHLGESLTTIDFARTGFGPLQPAWQGDEAKEGAWRSLVTCPHFALGELRLARGVALKRKLAGTCVAVTCIEGQGILATEDGSLPLEAMQTVLVPAAAQAWNVRSTAARLDLLLATPVLVPPA
jgi:mannose-6-phosphate isomerase